MDTLSDKARGKGVRDVGNYRLFERAWPLCSFTRCRPDEPWTFVVDVPQAPIRGDLELRSEVITPPHEKDFVHGPSLIATPTGLLAFWYRAVYEGAANAELVPSQFDGSHWSPTSVVTNSKTVTPRHRADDQIGRQSRSVSPLRQRDLAILRSVPAQRLGNVRNHADAEP